MSRAYLTGSLKELRGQYRESGTFYTPPELVAFIRSLIPGDPAEVYDPTCGTGALLAAFPDSTAKFGQDIEPAAVAVAEAELPNFHGAAGDVLVAPEWSGRRFPAIVANPPFSVKWTPVPDDPRWREAPTVPTAGRADFAFLLHIIASLDEGGVAAVLSFPGVCYRGGREATLRRWMVEDLNIVDRAIAVPGDTFTDTAIPTVCLVLRNGRTEGEPVRFEDREHDGLARDVPVSEIAEHDFDLSPTSYVQPPEPEREPVDPGALECKARADALRKIEAEIEFSRMVAEIEGWSIVEFLDDISRLVKRKRRTLIRNVDRAQSELWESAA